MKSNASNKMIFGFDLPIQRIRLWEIRQVFRLAGLSITEFAFHLGYIGIGLPRKFRKVFAKSKIHRSWFSSYTGAAIANVVEREEWRKPPIDPYDGYSDEELRQANKAPAWEVMKSR
ncbi:hypothetical protein [Microbulbifer sp. THAF38]|uniref:hypothetical protein n=1 Tax=Microbulbifer sp. THAF38 TaxID=2587856 RepID=UPI00126866DD|nr:hypothetical protein [Microbulbifer sp. THAF38]QFT57076.1 hypothetical protein FIU95_21225 [Microbulbifer sp. THAF38]